VDLVLLRDHRLRRPLCQRPSETLVLPRTTRSGASHQQGYFTARPLVTALVKRLPTAWHVQIATLSPSWKRKKGGCSLSGTTRARQLRQHQTQCGGCGEDGRRTVRKTRLASDAARSACALPRVGSTTEGVHCLPTNQIRDMLVSGYCAHTRTHQQKALISGRVQFALPLFSISFAQASHSVAL
jgi:hypothetical protein